MILSGVLGCLRSRVVDGSGEARHIVGQEPWQNGPSQCQVSHRTASSTCPNPNPKPKTGNLCFKS